MLSKLYRLLGARKEEEKAVESLLLYGFFMGVFLASFQPASLNLFIEHYKDSLDQAYLFQGIYGLVGAMVYTLLHRYVRFSIIVKLQPVLIMIVTMAGYYFYEIKGEVGAAYLLFIFFGPFQVISALIFWGLFGRIFQTHQSKRIIGGIDTGTLTAMIFIFFMIPLLTSKSIGLFNESIDLFYISILGTVGLFFMTNVIAKRYDINDLEKLTISEGREISFKNLFKNKFTLYLSFFLIISTLISKFVDFSYINVIELQYPKETERLNFISFAEGSIMVLSFIMQTFFNDRIIFNYGLKVSLMILPTILFLFTILAIPTGYLIDFSTGLVPFFILISVSKIISSALRDSLENPTFKLFFLIFRPRIRFEFQNKIEGVINQTGTILAGLIMTILGRDIFFHFETTEALLVLVIAILLLFYVINRMYNYYRKALQDSLKGGEGVHTMASKSLALQPILEKEIREGNDFSKIFAFKIMEIADPIQIQQGLFQAMFHENLLIRKYAVRRVGKIKAFKGVALVDQVVKFEQDEELKDYSKTVYNELNALVQKKTKSFHFFIMGKSDVPANREYLAKILARYPAEQHQQILIDLMRDENHYVRIAALVTAVSINNPKLWSVLLDMLKDPIQSSLAVCALVAIGQPVVKSLEFEYNKSTINVGVKRSIIRVFGRLANERCLDRLWYYLQDQNPLVQLEAAKALINTSEKANLLQIILVKKQIINYCELFYWNKMAITELDKEDVDLIKSLDNENDYNVDAIFQLLSLIYDGESIKLIRDNIYSKNYNRIAFSVELIDVLMDEDIKKTLIAIFDEISEQEMAQRLEFTFYRRDFTREKLLLEIINRSGSKIDLFTKCTALEMVLKELDDPFKEDIISNLFHSEYIIQELTFYYFYQADKIKTLNILSRVDKQIVNKLLKSVEFTSDHSNEKTPDLLLHKLQWLKNFDLFNILDNRDIIPFIYYFEEKKINKGSVLVNPYEWRDHQVYIVMDGVFEEVSVNNFQQYYEVGDIIGASTLFDLDDDGKCIAITDCLVYAIPRQLFYDQLIGNERYYQSIKNFVFDKYKQLFEPEVELNKLS